MQAGLKGGWGGGGGGGGGWGWGGGGGGVGGGGGGGGGVGGRGGGGGGGGGGVGGGGGGGGISATGARFKRSDYPDIGVTRHSDAVSLRSLPFESRACCGLRMQVRIKGRTRGLLPST